MTRYSREELIGRNCRFLQGGGRDAELNITRSEWDGVPVGVAISNDVNARRRVERAGRRIA